MTTRQKAGSCVNGNFAPLRPRPRAAKLGKTADDPVPVDLAVQVAAGELERRFDYLVWFCGELVQLTEGRGGQAYAVLRGPSARIDVYIPARHARDSRGVPVGSVVVVQGRLRIWRQGGRFQIAAESALLPTASTGARAVAREAAQRQLKIEGVFDRTRRDLPRYPTMVAVVTSGRGAAISDVRAAIRRRAPWVRVHLHDCTVQGPSAGTSIIAALDVADRSTADLIILTRGGGAPDTFDPFDDPAVVRRVAACRLPVLVAIGHEADRTLADLAADRAAATPTAAAELSVPDRDGLRREVQEHRRLIYAAAGAICAASRSRADGARDSARRGAIQRLSAGQERLRHVETRRLTAYLRRLLTRERQLLEGHWAGVFRLATALVRDGRRRAFNLTPALLVTHGEASIWADRQRVEELGRAIDALSPMQVLARGYALVVDAHGNPVRHSSDMRRGRTFYIRLHDGEVAAVVTAQPIQRPVQGEDL